MIVCHCHAIRARDVEGAIAGGARTPGEVARACGAGTGCGGCRPVIEELIEASGPAFSCDASASGRGTLRGEEHGPCPAATPS